MWNLPSQIESSLEQVLPPITYTHLLLLAALLLLLRSLIQKVLAVHFQITTIKPHHNINTLEYSYFYHLSLVILVMV